MIGHAPFLRRGRMMSRAAFVLGAILALGSANATPIARARIDGAAVSGLGERLERHHYSISARVRPLLVFWISKSGVGDALVTKQEGPSGAGYSLLIGSDPDRAPRRINRWGYIREDITGSGATLVGLMTQSDEDTIEEAEASIRRQAAGERTFKIIRGTIEGDEAKSVVSSVAAPASYSFKQVDTLLDIAGRQPSDGSRGRTRVIHLPEGTRPGFLAAVAELIHRHVGQRNASGRVAPGAPVKYVYYGRLYDLCATRTRALDSVRIGGVTYPRVIVSDFQSKSEYDGEITQFSLTYGTQGPVSGVLLAASYQPRWWMEIDLALDDGV